MAFAAASRTDASALADVPADAEAGTDLSS
jgi:hypothetical protein